MNVGIISYFDYDIYIKPAKKVRIYESWSKSWEEVFKLSKKNNINLKKYSLKNHKDFEKIIFIEIPRISDLLKVIYANVFRKKVFTILIVNETFLGRARYMLRIPFLFNKVLMNCEENIQKFLSYKIETFSYPSIPSRSEINSYKSKILNPNRKNKLVFISSFKIALSKHGSYYFRYKLVKDLVQHKKFFKLFGYGWDDTPLPFNVVGIAIIKRIPLLRKLVKSIMGIFFEPLGKFPLASSKLDTLSNYEFALAIEPTISKFNSICEKIFDPMIAGAIPLYYGQEFDKSIPENTYLRITKKDSASSIIKKIENLSIDIKKEYRRNIFNFLTSKSADRYRYSTYAKLVVNAILKKN